MKLNDLIQLAVRAGLLAVLAHLSACDRPAAEEKPEELSLPPYAKVAQHEELKADLTRRRDPSDGGGKAWIEPDRDCSGSTIGAGVAGRWKLLYEAGEHGIAVGGSLSFMPEPFWGWSQPQNLDPGGAGFTTAATAAEGVDLNALTLEGGLFRIEILGRALESGERIELVYGAGPARALPDRYAERDSRLWFAVDGDGDGVRAICEDSPRLTILPGTPAQLSLTLPSSAAPGDPVLLRVAVLDGVANVCSSFIGTVRLVAPPEGLGLPEEFQFGPEQAGCAPIAFRAGKAGILRLKAQATFRGREITATSNPLWVIQNPPPFLWADLHGHSNFSDGTGLPEDYFRYARDVAGLDAAALTDHDHFGVRFLDSHPQLWEEIRNQVVAFHEPGKFVTLLGFEWTSWLHGHRHVLYFQDEGELLSCLDPTVETPAQLWAGLEGQDALTFAHHSAGEPVPIDWRFRPDPRFEPVTEIMSVHGNSESPAAPRAVQGGREGNFVRDVLDGGVRFGFIGGGDSHDGHPGLPHLSAAYGHQAARPGADRDYLGTGGLAAILSPERTRKGIHRAMMERRVYATSGPRILLQVSIEGHRMGSVVQASAVSKTPKLNFLVIACAPLDRLEMVQKGRLSGRQKLQGQMELQGALPLNELQAGDYVYLRAIQQDGGVAWSSPIFFE
ncbi:MAG: CehA/McbA family metallohydrolase [Planctomycetota bacterium]